MKKRLGILITVMMLIFLVGCTTKQDSNQSEVNEPIKTTEFILGTVVDIQLYDENDKPVVEKVVKRLREIEALMTINREESDLQNLNNNKTKPYRVSEDTYKVIEKALHYAEISSGRFDPTIGPIIKLWNIGLENPRVPSQDELNNALKVVGYKKVKMLGDNTVSLDKDGMILDLGSIAKGYAADEAVKILKENGVKKAILNLGGNIYALGEKSEGTPWKIGIQDPTSDRGDYLGLVSIKNQTVVTSGIYERFFEENGVRYHHIIDPRTGYPVDNEVASVTIVSESSIDADALSTTLFVMGVSEGIRLIEKIENADAVFITKSGEITVSSGLKDNFKER